MPAHKYYCDYCDKQFYDTPASRKRHLQGVSHQRAKKQWFDSFREEESGLNQDAKKQLCSFFMRTGTCQYGKDCKFEHPSPPVPIQFGVPMGAAAPKGVMMGANANDPRLLLSNAPESTLPNYLVRDLPPSLRPPPEGGYTQHPPLDWG